MADTVSLSILISIFNQADFVEEMLASIEKQDYRDFEVIIVNDGSTDDTMKILDSSKYPWLQVVHKENGGKCSGFNRAFEASKGAYICLFAGDDIYMPDAFQTKINFIKARQLDFVKSKLQLLAPGSALNGRVVPKRAGRGNSSGGSLIFSRAFAEKAFPIPAELPNEDQWLNLVAERLGFSCGETGKVTYCLRLHDSNDFSRNMDFASLSRKMAARNKVHLVFVEKFAELLTSKERADLEALYNLDILRQKRMLVKILMSPVGARKKIWAIFHANAFLYNVKKAIRPLLIGL